MKIFKILKEINNYFFIGRIIKKNKNAILWKKHNLHVGYFNIIYTVINLPAEVFESEEQYYQAYVIEQLKPINEYLVTLNLQEIITVRIENKVNVDLGEYAFGIKYMPLFRYFSLWWIFKWTFVVSMFLWINSKFDIIHKLKELFIYVVHFL